MVLPTATVLPCRGDGRRKNPGQFFSFSNQCRIVTHTRVTKIPEPICSFVRFFEHDAKLGLELRVRSTAPRGAIVRPYPVGCPPKLISGLLRFRRFGERSAEVKNSEGEQFRPGKQVEPRHPHDEARTVPTRAQRMSRPFQNPRITSLYFLRTFPPFHFSSFPLISAHLPQSARPLVPDPRRTPGRASRVRRRG